MFLYILGHLCVFWSAHVSSSLECQRIPESQKSLSDQMNSNYMGLEDSKKPRIFSEK